MSDRVYKIPSSAHVGIGNNGDKEIEIMCDDKPVKIAAGQTFVHHPGEKTAVTALGHAESPH